MHILKFPWFLSLINFYPSVLPALPNFYDILEKKHAFLSYKNKKFKNSKTWHISKRVNPWFWSKNGHYSNFYFLRNIGQENVFYDILERNNAFLGYENKKFKKSKN